MSLESKERLKRTPRILVTGSEGLVGSRFCELSYPEYKSVFSPDVDELDITNGKKVNQWVGTVKPDVLINFSTMTDAEAIEKERGDYNGSAWKVNVLGAENLAEACFRNQTFLIYLSAYEVFPWYQYIPRTDGPFAEDSPVARSPEETSWYGWTKREGERLVQEIMGRERKYAIVRIAQPILASLERTDYAREILELYKKGKLEPRIEDGTISPTYIDELVEALLKIVEMRAEISDLKPEERIFHVVSRNVATHLSHASYLVWRFTGKRKKLKGIPIVKFYNDHPEMYRMPRSGLHCDYTQRRLGMRFMGWQGQIEELYRQYFSLYKNIN